MNCAAPARRSGSPPARRRGILARSTRTGPIRGLQGGAVAGDLISGVDLPCLFVCENSRGLPRRREITSITPRTLARDPVSNDADGEFASGQKCLDEREAAGTC